MLEFQALMTHSLTAFWGGGKRTVVSEPLNTQITAGYRYWAVTIVLTIKLWCTVVWTGVRCGVRAKMEPPHILSGVYSLYILCLLGLFLREGIFGNVSYLPSHTQLRRFQFSSFFSDDPGLWMMLEVVV